MYNKYGLKRGFQVCNIGGLVLGENLPFLTVGISHRLVPGMKKTVREMKEITDEYWCMIDQTCSVRSGKAKSRHVNGLKYKIMVIMPKSTLLEKKAEEKTL